MKKYLFTLINKMGYRIINKHKEREQLIVPLKKYQIEENFNTLFQSKYYIQNLENKFKNLSIINHKEGFLVRFLDLNIYVESEEEFHILNEIFVRNDYDFSSGVQSIVIDIGANIGITSLFFSRLNYVDKIYAFEPVKETFEQAVYNFSLNVTIQKIVLFKNIGLGKNSRKEVFLFDNKWKGNTGLRGKSSPSYEKNANAKQIEVQLESATLEIAKIIAENSGKKVIVKMDCEGGEYEILEDLYQSEMLHRIDVLLLEWHDRGSQLIEEILINSGFDYFSRNYDALTGMIYAFKN